MKNYKKNQSTKLCKPVKILLFKIKYVISDKNKLFIRKSNINF